MRRIQFCSYKNLKDKRVATLKPNDVTFDGLLKLSKNKLRLKATKVYDDAFNELSADDFSPPSNRVERVLNEPKAYFVLGDQNAQLTPVVADDTVRVAGENASTQLARQDASEARVHVISGQSYVDGAAVQQLHECAKLLGMRHCVGMPDLHPGRGYPIGAACASENYIYPHLVGTDIGCGMSLFRTTLKRARIEWLLKNLRGLDVPFPGNVGAFLEAVGVAETAIDRTHLGTIGGGNHFAELQEVERIVNAEGCAKLGIDANCLHLLVHSGSRQLGERILHAHVDAHGNAGLLDGSDEAIAYFEAHNHAVEWARANRALITRRFMSCIQQGWEKFYETETLDDGGEEDAGEPIDDSDELIDDDVGEVDDTDAVDELVDDADRNDVTSTGTQADDDSVVAKLQRSVYDDAKGRLLLDITHNHVIPKSFEDGSRLFLHRKGAAPTDAGAVVIPGSRGAWSYVVQPLTDNADAMETGAYSLAHGAGRRWPRGKALDTGKRVKASELTRTSLGSRVICESKTLLYEEQPDAYKDIDGIIADLEAAKMIRVLCVMRPLITYKLRAAAHKRRDKSHT